MGFCCGKGITGFGREGEGLEYGVVESWEAKCLVIYQVCYGTRVVTIGKENRRWA